MNSICSEDIQNNVSNPSVILVKYKNNVYCYSQNYLNDLIKADPCYTLVSNRYDLDDYKLSQNNKGKRKYPPFRPAINRIEMGDPIATRDFEIKKINQKNRIQDLQVILCKDLLFDYSLIYFFNKEYNTFEITNSTDGFWVDQTSIKLHTVKTIERYKLINLISTFNPIFEKIDDEEVKEKVEWNENLEKIGMLPYDSLGNQNKFDENLIIFFAEDSNNNKNIFSLSLAELKLDLETKNIENEGLYSIENHLTILLGNYHIDVVPLIDLLNQGVNTFYLIKFSDENKIIHSDSRKNIYVYKPIPASRKDILPNLDLKDRFEVYNFIENSDYIKEKDGTVHLRLYNVDNHGNETLNWIKYKDDSNFFVFDSWNDEAAIISIKNGRIASMTWCKDGIYHRDQDNLPARIIYENNRVKSKHWYINGKEPTKPGSYIFVNYKTDKPANQNVNDSLLSYKYLDENGNILSYEASYFENGEVEEEKWFKNGNLIGEENNPSWILNYKNGRLMMEYWNYSEVKTDKPNAIFYEDHKESPIVAKYWERNRIGDKDRPNIIFYVGDRIKGYGWGELKITKEGEFEYSRKGKPAFIRLIKPLSFQFGDKNDIDIIEEHWLENNFYYRENNEPTIVEYFLQTETIDSKELLDSLDYSKYKGSVREEKWVEGNFYNRKYYSNDGNPCEIVYYKSRIQGDMNKGSILSEKWFVSPDEIRLDEPNLIKYFPYMPEIMVLLLDRYKHLMEPGLYERNRAIYKNDAKKFEHETKLIETIRIEEEMFPDETKLIDYNPYSVFKNIFDCEKTDDIDVFKEEKEVKERKGQEFEPKTMPNNLKYYLEKNPDGKGFINSMSWTYGINSFDRENGPAYIVFYENGQRQFESWYRNGKNHRDGNYPTETFYYSNGEIEMENYYHNGVLFVPVPFEETDDENEPGVLYYPDLPNVGNRDLNENDVFEEVFPDDP